MEQIKTGHIFDRRKVDSVIVIGAGAIGCAVASHLAKLNVPFTLVDNDNVEGHNLSNQCLYGSGSIGKNKAFEASSVLQSLSDTKVSWFAARVENRMIATQHIFLCVDNMASRKDIASLSSKTVDSILIDGRMGARDCSSYLFQRDNPEHRQRYMETVFEDADAHHEKTACGIVLSIGATAQIVAAHMIWQWMDCVMGRKTVNEVHMGVDPWFLRTLEW